MTWLVTRISRLVENPLSRCGVHESPVTSHQSRVYPSSLSQPLFVFAGRSVARADDRGGGGAEDARGCADGYEWVVCGGAVLSGGDSRGNQADCGSDAGCGVGKSQK